MKFMKMGFAVLAIAASSVACAQMYVVGSVGSASVKGVNQSDIDQELIDAGVTGLTSSIDKRDTSYQVQLGYQVNKNFAVEGGYVDLGEVSYSASFTGGSATAKVKASGINVAALGILPLSDAFSLYGKLGFIDAKVKADVSATGPGGTASGSASATKWKTNWGLGGTYNFSKQMGVRVAYDRYDNLGDNNTTGTADVDVISAGVVLKF